MLRADRAKRAFCGGSEGGLYPDVINRLAKEGIVDKSAEATDCYRVGARGGLLAEGAAVVTLETEEVLKHRKSFPHAKIVGYSNGYIPAFKEIDVEDISTFYVKCMRRALADAGLEKDVVSLVQGTGFGHEKIDKAEAMAVRILFGSQVAFTGSNGIFDFTLGASGAMSLVTAVTQMNSGSMVPIRNANELHLQNQIDYVTAATTVRSIDVALVNCFDYLGCMVSVVIEKSGA
jgi:3-oxoacyl-[acyl-carrier-protein] synthase II